ncbi:MAG: DUF6452 family protein [Weeksellaceae bacterium]
MKLYHYLFFLGLIAFMTSCEDEDICIDQTTPQLVMNLHKVSQATLMDSVIIYRENKSGKFDLITATPIKDTSDVITIKVPLPIDERNQVKFILGKRRYDPKYQDTLTVHYNTELHFVSKACGFGVHYLNTQYSLSNHYYTTLITLQDEITSEATPHIRLNY